MAKTVETRRMTIIVKDWKWEKDEDGRYTKRVDFPDVVTEVDVTVCWDDIAQQLGTKAYRSKTGKSQDLGGLVTAYRVGG